MWYYNTRRANALPHRRYLVADRDRLPHDRAAARRDAAQPGSCTLPLPGIIAATVNEAAPTCTDQHGGFPRHQAPLPSQIRHHWGTLSATKNPISRRDARRVFWPATPPPRQGRLFSGSWARRRRTESVRPPASARWEIESALVANPLVAEAAVVGRPHDIKAKPSSPSSY